MALYMYPIKTGSARGTSAFVISRVCELHRAAWEPAHQQIKKRPSGAEASRACVCMLVTPVCCQFRGWVNGEEVTCLPVCLSVCYFMVLLVFFRVYLWRSLWISKALLSVQMCTSVDTVQTACGWGKNVRHKLPLIMSVAPEQTEADKGN